MCAQGGNRTLTLLPEQVFETCASTNSATRAKIVEYYKYNIR